ncbi:MAG TPA: hypothetical protein VFN87_11330 [Solirubrobacteraceae bacterium]|nr:hypothetical protein [Solirubrobacteraceae bacterium]
MRRLVGLAVALVAVPVMAWVILGSGGHARAAVAPGHSHALVSRGAAHAKTILVPSQAGSTCYVAAGACSQTPCTEFVQSQSTVLVAPAAGSVVPSRAGRCPSGVARPARPATSGSVSVSPGVVPISQSLVTGALAKASRALSRATAAGGG